MYTKEQHKPTTRLYEVNGSGDWKKFWHANGITKGLKTTTESFKMRDCMQIYLKGCQNCQ